MDLTQNLDCYDFYPELTALEDYARQAFLKCYQIPANDPIVQITYFSPLDPTMLPEEQAYITPYGIIRRNENEMVLEYSNPQTGQQML
ncbi:hypothetical protein [Anaerovirgula multivorans]|uniref:hypothetical protein n=1 Tax=Anaerovirgula multivorans TaxID=312168 RepID=UPI00113189BC|nr:hypothetical protein [Anaerovirgula multivorans]